MKNISTYTRRASTAVAMSCFISRPLSMVCWLNIASSSLLTKGENIMSPILCLPQGAFTYRRSHATFLSVGVNVSLETSCVLPAL